MITNDRSRLNEETMIRIADAWLAANHDSRDIRTVGNNLWLKSKRGMLRKQFEDWLWSNGAEIRQYNHKLCIEFFDQRAAVWFIMKYA